MAMKNPQIPSIHEILTNFKGNLISPFHLRKWTTPYHYICGALTILGSIHFGWWVAPLCFLCFLAIEVWNKKEWAASQNDFWEYTAGVFITLGLCLVLM